MSSIISTPDELSSNRKKASGRCWRVVEAQNQISTTKLTDSSAEQHALELLIEETKPPVPAECRHLNFLLSTPFRYGAAYPRGSRFRRAGFTPGVFYASERVETAIAELCFLRLLFFSESPDTKWPANAGKYTAFAAKYATERSVDLTLPPFDSRSEIWMHPTDYEPCQALAAMAREADIELIRYASVRDRSTTPISQYFHAGRSRIARLWPIKHGACSSAATAHAPSASCRGASSISTGTLLSPTRASHR